MLENYIYVTVHVVYMDACVNPQTYDKERAIICPKCNRVLNGQYLINMMCPSCGTHLSESNYVNWINKNETCDIANKIARSKKLESDDDGC